MVHLSHTMIAGNIILSSLTASRKQYQNKPQPSVPFFISFPKTIEFIPSGAKTQKIKRIDYSKCNVRASKNAEQAFSTLRYLYICYTQDFVFSSMIILKH